MINYPFIKSNSSAYLDYFNKVNLIINKLYLFYNSAELFGINISFKASLNRLSAKELYEHRCYDNNTILHIIFLSLSVENSKQLIDKRLEILKIIHDKILTQNNDIQILFNNFITHENNNGFCSINLLQKIYVTNTNKYFSLVKYFLNNFSNYKLDKFDRTSLHYAILLSTHGKQKRFLNEIIKPIIKKNINSITKNDKYGYNILHYAITQSYKIASYLITSYPFLTNQENIYGNTPLHLLTITHPFNVYNIIYSKLRNSEKDVIDNQKNIISSLSIKRLKNFINDYLLLKKSKENEKLRLLKKYNYLQQELIRQMSIKNINHKNNDGLSAYDILCNHKKAENLLIFYQNPTYKNYIAKEVANLFNFSLYHNNLPTLLTLRTQLSSFLQNPLFYKRIYAEIIKKKSINEKSNQLGLTENTIYKSYLFDKIVNHTKCITTLQKIKTLNIDRLKRLNQDIFISNSLSIIIFLIPIIIFIYKNTQNNRLSSLSKNNMLFFSLNIIIFSIILYYNQLALNAKLFNTNIKVKSLNQEIKTILDNKPNFQI